MQTVEDLEISEFEDRPWEGIGRSDCYALGKDFYNKNFPDITITDFVRPHNWSSDKLDLIRGLYKHDGFVMITDWTVDDLQPADVLAMNIGEGNPNHIAIYVGEGDILHHLYGKRSRREPFHGFWRDKVAFILRHPDVPNLNPPKIELKLEDFIRARNDFSNRGLHGTVRSDSE